MTESPSGARVVLITGAAYGIGAAVARGLASEGARLVLHARDDASQPRLTELTVECLDAGAPACHTVYAELGTEAAVRTIIDAAGSHFGALDQIVANAGYARQGELEQLSWDSLERAFAAMPMSFAALVRLALPLLAVSRCAAVVAVSSFVAHRFRLGQSFAETAAAKAALEALARTAAVELAARGITVNCVVPGFTRKDRRSTLANAAVWARAAQDTPTQRIAEPEEIAGAIRYLLGPAARQITGTLLHIDGGLTSG
jgi:3-oxoacyl-[acyl-carrier protein] reductase